MALWSIPTFQDPFYRQTTRLDGSDYVLKFEYNSRERCWYLTVSTPSGQTLAAGLKVVANVNLIGKCSNAALPPGALLAFTSSGDASPPDLGELGAGLRCELLYVDAAGLA